MDENSNQVIITEKSLFFRRQKWIIAMLVFIACLAVISFFTFNYSNDLLTKVAPADPIENPETIEKAEVIHFSAVPRENNDLELPILGSYNTVTEAATLYWDYPGRSLRETDSAYTALLVKPEINRADVIQPTVLEKTLQDDRRLEKIDKAISITDLTVSNDGGTYAYTFFDPTEEFPEDELNLKHQSVAVHYGLEEPYIIKGAMNPVLIDDDRSLVYMQSDGIYRVDLNTASSALLLTPPQLFSVNDNYDIAEDGSVLVVTIPSLNRLSINLPDTNTNLFSPVHVTEAAAQTAYFYPKISPDASRYAVVRKDIVNREDPENINITTQVELHTTDDAVIINTLPVPPEVIPESIQLSGWGSTI